MEETKSENKMRTGEETVEAGASDGNKAREYIAFISYRHKDLDKFVARKLHTLIERYVVPKELRKNGSQGLQKGGFREENNADEVAENSKSTGGRNAEANGEKNAVTGGSRNAASTGKHLGLVFRDEEELPVSSNLTESIQTALDNAKYLIVVCTPNTPESIWVEREISYFLQKHDRAHVIGVLADGTPDESFPKLLTTVYAEDGITPIGAVEPLAANLTDNAHHFDKRRIKKEAVRLYAALLGCPFDTLWQRDRRYKMRCTMAFMALVLTIALAFCVSIYLKNLQIMARNQQIEEQNVKIQAQNDEIKSQYDEIQNKNAELRRNEAETLIREGELLYEKGDTARAAERAVQAISTKEGMEAYAADAEYLLQRSLGAGQYDNVFRTVGVIEQECDVRDLLVSHDGKRFFTMDDRGMVRCYSAGDATLCWIGDGNSKTYHGYVADRPRMADIEAQGYLLCMNEDGIAALHMEDGTAAWQYDMDRADEADFAFLSQDEKLLAVIVGGTVIDPVNTLIILNVEDGAVLQEIAMPDYDGMLLEANGRVNGAFSEDKRYLAGMVYEKRNLYYGYSAYSIFLADLKEGTVRVLTKKEIEAERFSVKPFVIGLYLNPANESVMALHYDMDSASVRMEKASFDGRDEVLSEVPLTLPSRDLSGPYHCYFAPGKENGCIWASCQELSLLYVEENGEFISARKYSTANILAQHWMNEKYYTRSMLTEYGEQYAFYEEAGLAVGSFTDKIHIAKIAVSDDYAQNQGDFGHELVRDAVAVLMCDDNSRRVYLQKPAKDEAVEEAAWGIKPEEYKGVTTENLYPLGDHQLMYAMTKGSKAYMRLVDVSSQEIIWEGEFTGEDMPDQLDPGELLGGVFWKDGQCVSRTIGFNKLGYYDLRKKKLTPVFGGEVLCSSCILPMADGRVLQAAVVVADRTKENDFRGKLVVQVEDGEMTQIANAGEEYWMAPIDWSYRAALWTGANGYVVIGQYATDQKGDAFGNTAVRMDSYYFYGVNDGASGEIPDECPMTSERKLIVGKELPLFATADEDGYVRVYDMARKKSAEKLSLPVKYDEVQNILFCDGDQAIAVWTKDRMLFIYGISGSLSGKLLYQGGLDQEKTEATFEIELCCVEDPTRGRCYFKTSRNTVICVDTRFWKKVADYKGMDAFCPGTNEIYRLKINTLYFREEREGILRYKALTLEELAR